MTAQNTNSPRLEHLVAEYNDICFKETSEFVFVHEARVDKNNKDKIIHGMKWS